MFKLILVALAAVGFAAAQTSFSSVGYPYAAPVAYPSSGYSAYSPVAYSSYPGVASTHHSEYPYSAATAYSASAYTAPAYAAPAYVSYTHQPSHNFY